MPNTLENTVNLTEAKDSSQIGVVTLIEQVATLLLHGFADPNQ